MDSGLSWRRRILPEERVSRAGAAVGEGEWVQCRGECYGAGAGEGAGGAGAGKRVSGASAGEGRMGLAQKWGAGPAQGRG